MDGGRKKIGILKKVIILILTLSIVMLVGFAYAKYITRFNGTTTAYIAKWSFDYRILNNTQTKEISDFSITRTDNNSDVDSSKIAPGTSGQFIVEIDATGTETLLTYETKMTFTNKPKNLKFYSDSNKTQELVVENETYLAFNGFMSLEDNKKRDIPIYWDWTLETGSSQKEIYENDLIDSEFMGRTMSMKIAVNGTQVMSDPYTDVVASTTINGKITNYNTVQDAIDAAGQNQGVVVTFIKDNINEEVLINDNQSIVLNTNGKTLTSSTTTINNLGNLKITGNGTVKGTAGSATILNSGKIEVLEVNILASDTGSGIKNNEEGILNVCGAIINAKEYAIENYGISVNEEQPSVKIVKGTIMSSKSYCIDNFGIGTIDIIYGNIDGFSGVRNRVEGIIIIREGKITTGGGHGVRNYTGNIIMHGGEIKTGNWGDGIWTSSTGNVLVTGGTIIGATNGIVTEGAGVIEIGVNDKNISNSIPMIIATRGKGINTYGHRAIIKFYDGIVKAPTNKVLIDVVDDKPQGYKLLEGETEIIDETEYNVTYLVKE